MAVAVGVPPGVNVVSAVDASSELASPVAVPTDADGSLSVGVVSALSASSAEVAVASVAVAVGGSAVLVGIAVGDGIGVAVSSASSRLSGPLQAAMRSNANDTKSAHRHRPFIALPPAASSSLEPHAARIVVNAPSDAA
jgi:hypothetical protein